jgi:hypothetical protein
MLSRDRFSKIDEILMRFLGEGFVIMFLRKNLKNLVLIGFCSIGIIHECWISMFKLSLVVFHGWMNMYENLMLGFWIKKLYLS